jgi:hypothetical protein
MQVAFVWLVIPLRMKYLSLWSFLGFLHFFIVIANFCVIFNHSSY